MENSAYSKIAKILEMAGASDQFELCMQMWKVAQGDIDPSYFSKVFWATSGWQYFELLDGSLAVMGHIKGTKGDVLFTFAAPDAPGSEWNNHGVMAFLKEAPQAGRLKILTWLDNEWVSNNRLVCRVAGLFTVWLQLEQGQYVVYTVDAVTGVRTVAPGGPFDTVLHAKVGAQRWLNDLLGGLFND